MPIARTHARMLIALAVALASACGDTESAPCTVGEASCACAVGNTCHDGLVCDPEANVCEGTRSVGLPSIDAAARSCEVLIEDDGANVVRAAFAESVRGETVRQAPRTAVTFHANTDAPIAASAVRIELAGAGGMTIARARCFDRDGHPIPGGGMSTGG